MDQNKPAPPVEQSMKYMAWNVKQIDANVKRIADSLEMIVQGMRRPQGKSSEFVQGEIPF